LTAKQPILIAGAGIGGLATALALAQHNLASRVLEKRTDPSEEGAGIQIGPNGVHVLRQLGVADALAPLTASPVSLRIMDGVSGRELTVLPLGSTIAERHGAPYWSAHRADLHATLFQAARDNPLVTLSLGSEVQSAVSHSTEVGVVLSDSSQLSAPALIAADGLWSRLRDTVFKAKPLQHTSKHAYRAVIPAENLPASLSKTSTYIWLSPRAHVVHYPVRSGQEIALVVVLSDTETMLGWGTNVPSARLRSRFEGSASALRDLIDQPDSWRGWPLMVPSGSTGWVDGRIALLGDAAHPILPFLAQGAVMALEDAVTVAGCMAYSPNDIPKALATYASQRLARTDCVARASQRNGQVYHLPGPLAAIRNSVLRKAPQHRLLASYDWLYGWRSIGQN
jgi:salicylate hydroxylase